MTLSTLLARLERTSTRISAVRHRIEQERARHGDGAKIIPARWEADQ